MQNFCGIIRQAGGCNNHPNAPTFLQLYKLLSLFGVVRPPAKGNCSVTENQPRLIGIAQLKDAFKATPTQNLAEKLEEQLKMTIVNEDEACDDYYIQRFLEATPEQGIAYFNAGSYSSILKQIILKTVIVADSCTLS